VVGKLGQGVSYHYIFHVGRFNHYVDRRRRVGGKEFAAYFHLKS